MKDSSIRPQAIGNLRQSLNSRIGNIPLGMLIGYKSHKLEMDVSRQVVGVIAEPVSLVIKNEKLGTS